MNDFHLVGEDNDFKTRSSEIFSSFDSIKSEAAACHAVFSKAVNKKSACSTKKPPEPGFKSEPEKWTKYDLIDTSCTDDRQNTQAAMSFLYEMAKRSRLDINSKPDQQCKSEKMNEISESKGSKFSKVICFKKPTPRVMGEHEVGKAEKKVSKMSITGLCKPSQASFDKVDLDHLDENISAIEYQADIEARFNETYSQEKCPNNEKQDQETASQLIFKSRKLQTNKRCIRKRNSSEN